MSYNDYQQKSIDLLLTTDFKKQYDLIPKEFINNYFFQNFLFNLAKINIEINTCKEIGIDPEGIIEFNVSETEEAMDSIVECTVQNKDYVNKNCMSVHLEKNGVLHFIWTFAFIHGKEYNAERDNIVYELSMMMNDDKTKIWLEHTTTSKRENPWKCYMASIFDTHINEICRVAEAIDTKTNEVLFHEEFVPVGTVDSEKLHEWQKEAEKTPICLLGTAGGNLNVKEVKYHQSIKEVYVGKCSIGDNTRYAIFWKSDNYVNKSFQESFESISYFGAPGLNLSYKLDLKENPCLVEISEEEYKKLLGNESEVKMPQLRLLLK